MSVKKEDNTNEPLFSKEMILKSKRFKNRRDALNVILNDNEELTVEEVQKRLDEFMKRKVV